ncbi:hypothetical protein MSIMFB_04404 [Mycobacterium simulans]|uniref:Uncharacterized protein n=1 Tax=Mycobacterium simulans TaxID=627089 RepID=A0A7Z7IQM7_9MYCO|nr:hypothetical protein [Mycobacterium simulans]SOJ56926.1 hypothetical protein MSIMFB_04404 [Mycobacterium simulans]
MLGGSSIYPLIETLGAATDLTALRDMADSEPDVAQRIDVPRQAVAALDANTTGAQMTTTARPVRVLVRAQGVTV